MGYDTFMEAYISPPDEDVNKFNGRAEMEFSDDFKRSFDDALTNYDDTMKYLKNLVEGKGFTEDYGVCSCRYQLMYLKPKDLASFIGDMFKAISSNLIDCTFSDVEKLAVGLAKQYIATNTGNQLTRDNLFASSTYGDPRVDTLMDILVQIENAFFDRAVYSKYEMIERAKSMKDDLSKMTELNFTTAMKAVVNALPNTIKDTMKESNMVPCDCELIMVYIETFILFMCSLNTTALEQMISYAQPRATFIKKAASKFVGETYADTAFNGYITECCMLKTNTMNIRARIPFDCNMRNVVLEDMTPGFKDTKSALFFMLKDSRSPIHVLLAKYASVRKLGGGCEPVMAMFRQYFYRPIDCMDNPLRFEYDKVGFRTDVNWLDKIAYGNQFLDGNYRMDAMGNDNRHPIKTALEMLHRMYCGCDLKTNEDLANQIIKISDAMTCIISNEIWTVENRALVTDMLAVLGECFTRCVLRLYHNNATVVAFDDAMPDTMIPGYTYCEYFVVQEAENAAPSVEIAGSQNTAPKTGGLSKLGTALRQFGKWVSVKLANFKRAFAVTNEAKIKWVTSHDELNKKVAAALGKELNVTMKNVPQYKIPAAELKTKLEAAQSKFGLAINQAQKDSQITDEELLNIKRALYPGDDAVAEKIARTEDEKQRVTLITNYVLYKTTEPTPEMISKSGPMTADQWNDIVSTLSGSTKLIEQLNDAMTKTLNSEIKELDKLRQQDERATTQNQGQQGQQQQPVAAGNAQKVYDVVQQVLKDYQLNALNKLAGTMFKTYYGIYKQIVDAYRQQTATEKASAPATEESKDVAGAQPAMNPA